MKQLTKAANLLTILAILPILLLTSCADMALPTWLTGEPDEAVLNAPRIVGRPPGANDKTYPNLAAVPERPKDFSTAASRKKTIQEMQNDKTEAEDIRERLEAVPAPGSSPSIAPQSPLLLGPDQVKP